MTAKLICLVALVLISGAFSKKCECSGNNCGCCAQVSFKIPIVNKQFDAPVCSNITWDGNSLSVDLSLSINGKIVASKNISASGGICYGLPYGAEVCVGIENLYVDPTNHTLSGCADIYAELVKIKVVDIKLGCFHINVPHKGENEIMLVEDMKRDAEGTLCMSGYVHCCAYQVGEDRVVVDAFRAPAACPTYYAGKYELCRDKCVKGRGGTELCQDLNCSPTPPPEKK